jgi:hypothetical protein
MILPGFISLLEFIHTYVKQSVQQLNFITLKACPTKLVIMKPRKLRGTEHEA